MTRDEIVVMAGKAGLPILWITETGVIKWADLERFTALVAEAEREACAKECDKVERRKWELVMNGGGGKGIGARDCAIAIRARGAT